MFVSVRVCVYVCRCVCVSVCRLQTCNHRNLHPTVHVQNVTQIHWVKRWTYMSTDASASLMAVARVTVLLCVSSRCAAGWVAAEGCKMRGGGLEACDHEQAQLTHSNTVTVTGNGATPPPVIMSSHSMQDASVTTMMVRLSDLRERGVTRDAGEEGTFTSVGAGARAGTSGGGGGGGRVL